MKRNLVSELAADLTKYAIGIALAFWLLGLASGAAIMRAYLEEKQSAKAGALPHKGNERGEE